MFRPAKLRRLQEVCIQEILWAGYRSLVDDEVGAADYRNSQAVDFDVAAALPCRFKLHPFDNRDDVDSVGRNSDLVDCAFPL